MFISDGPSSLGGPSSSKKTKDKSSISRSQSQRPAGDQDRFLQRFKPTSSKVSGDKPGAKADTALHQDPLTDPNKTQHEPAGETNVTNTQNTNSEPAPCRDVSPSGGSSAALQHEICDMQGSITQTGADLTPEKASSPPLCGGNDQTHEDGGLESRPVSEPKEEAESTVDKGNQSSDSSRWFFYFFSFLDVNSSFFYFIGQ